MSVDAGRSVTMVYEHLQRLRQLGVTDAEIARELGVAETLLTENLVDELSDTQQADLKNLATRGDTYRKAPGTHTSTGFGRGGMRVHSTDLPASLPASAVARAEALAEVRSLLQSAHSRESDDYEMGVSFRLTFATGVTVPLPTMTVTRALEQFRGRNDAEALEWLTGHLHQRYATGSLGKWVVRKVSMNIYQKS